MSAEEIKYCIDNFKIIYDKIEQILEKLPENMQEKLKKLVDEGKMEQIFNFVNNNVDDNFEKAGIKLSHLKLITLLSGENYFNNVDLKNVIGKLLDIYNKEELLKRMKNINEELSDISSLNWLLSFNDSKCEEFYKILLISILGTMVNLKKITQNLEKVNMNIVDKEMIIDILNENRVLSSEGALEFLKSLPSPIIEDGTIAKIMVEKMTFIPSTQVEILNFISPDVYDAQLFENLIDKVDDDKLDYIFERIPDKFKTMNIWKKIIKKDYRYFDKLPVNSLNFNIAQDEYNKWVKKIIINVITQNGYDSLLVYHNLEPKIKEFNLSEEFSKIVSIITETNSSEIKSLGSQIFSQILESPNPLEKLDKIEKMFVKNNIPTVGKAYSCFEILHPNFQGFNFENSPTISPILKKSSNMSRRMIIFSDLIKASFGSNNRAVNAYLKNIEVGSSLYEQLKKEEINIYVMDIKQLKELETFLNHLITLYENTNKGKKENESFKPSGDVVADISELVKRISPDGTLNYNLPDRIIRMFCGFAGIDTLKQAQEYIEDKINNADARNRMNATFNMTLEQGDLVKGIGTIKYLRNILQNGSVAKEYLGASAESDRTPLDTDLSMIMNSDESIKKKIDVTVAKEYGPIWFVLKNDDRFITTRTNGEPIKIKRDMSKMELFYTGTLGQNHYGIRTGFASSEINYILMENYDPRVGLEIAMNGFYIPVANMEGKIIFTPKDYDELRAKMSGLSYFKEESYNFSNNLLTSEVKTITEHLNQNMEETQIKNQKIYELFRKSFDNVGLELKTTITGNLEQGFVETLNTGSTGRGTNLPGNDDFDYMIRIDRSILYDKEKMEKLRKTIVEGLGKEYSSEDVEKLPSGDLRIKNVKIGYDTVVPIDIDFIQKTDKVAYSTEMALQDRLSTIKKVNPVKYQYVVANILLAKKILKEAKVYKSFHSRPAQGGLGGVGVENWILQNGGSFIDASKNFLEATEGKAFEEFKKAYQIWDFGDNHLAQRHGDYPNDNFITSNMNEEGYKKMQKVLKEYLQKLSKEDILTSAEDFDYVGTKVAEEETLDDFDYLGTAAYSNIESEKKRKAGADAQAMEYMPLDFEDKDNMVSDNYQDDIDKQRKELEEQRRRLEYEKKIRELQLRNNELTLDMLFEQQRQIEQEENQDHSMSL